MTNRWLGRFYTLGGIILMCLGCAAWRLEGFSWEVPVALVSGILFFIDGVRG